MANKSVTWTVGADTSAFIKGMNNADRSIKQTEKNAAELKKGLQFEWNEQRFVKAQELAQKALTDTEEKAVKIREQLKYLEDTGGVDTAGYERLQTELIKTENKAVLLKHGLEDINTMQPNETIESFKKVEKEISSSSEKLKELNRQLKIAPTDENYVKVQQELSKAISLNEEKAGLLRQQYDELAAQTGVTTETLEDLENQILKTENDTDELRQETEKLRNEYEKTIPKTNQLAQSATNLGEKLDAAAKKTKGLSLAAGGAIAGMAALANKAITTGDDIQTLADQFDMSAESVQYWQYIALQSDVPATVLFNSVKKMRSALGQQLVGDTNAATTALEKLGIRVENFPDAESAFQATLMQLSLIENKTLQAHYANEIYGEKIATQLIPLLNQGADGLKEFAAEFESVGYMSNETVAELSKADNVLNKVKTQFSLATTELGIAFLPMLRILVEFLQKNVIPIISAFAKWFSDLPQPIQNAMLGILLFTAALSPILKIGGALFKVVGNIIGVIPKLITLLQKVNLASLQTYAGFAAIIGAVMLINDLFKNWGEMSTVEKILKSLAVAALIAAGAIMIFHASWSLGIAIGAIVAGIAAGAAAINAAGKSFGIETPGGSSGTSSISTPNMTLPDYDLDRYYTSGSSSIVGDTINDNSVITINIYDAEQMSKEEIAAEVLKELALKKLGYR